MLPASLPKLHLTPRERHEYANVAQCVRDHTVAKLEAYLTRPVTTGPAFDKRNWKLLKQKEHFRIYASRKTRHVTAFPKTRALYRGSAIQRSAEWQPQTKLQCVGSYIGTLDDAMYGGVTPTEKAMMVRSLGIQDQFVDHKTLCDITIPTEDDPFTYAGLKWSARPPYLATMVKPRDLTYVQSTGFCEINNNGNIERVGYFVYHSVDIPEVPELTEQGFRRCRFSLSVISRPTSAGTIEVFATVASDAGGDLPRELTTLFSANALLGIHKAMDNALKKKLVWLRATRSRALSDPLRSLARPRRNTYAGTSLEACPQCTRSLFALQKLQRCHVCEACVCSRCLSPQTLVLGATKSQLTRVEVPICHGCMTTAAQMDVRALAIAEFVRPFELDARVKSLRTRRRVTRTMSADWAMRTPRMTRTISTDSAPELSTHHRSVSHGTPHALVTRSLDRTEFQHYINDRDEEQPQHDATSEADTQRRLWMQIYKLRIQAERTYHATTHQSYVVQQLYTKSSL